MSTKVQLTKLAACGGCAGKAGALTLSGLLKHLSLPESGHDPNLLVGLDSPDDATVFKLNDREAVVLTIDFFAPLVDDPYDYGSIAAANAMSDVYAMGAEVAVALNVAAFPEDMPTEVMAAILQGGADKVSEAGATVAGGHTIIDAEPKYGLSVMGVTDPERMLTKGGASPGDILFLTKPLGTGIIVGAETGKESKIYLDGAIASMKGLNRRSSQIAVAAGATAMTDVTGFSILGHGYEMARASKAAIRISASNLPTLDGALQYANEGVRTRGHRRNWAYLEDKVQFSTEPDEATRAILLDPQTSGGLLFAASAASDSEIRGRFAGAGLPVWQVGEVTDGQGVEVIV